MCQSFSPLLIGAMVETQTAGNVALFWNSFSPLLIGAMVETDAGHDGRYVRSYFQSPFNRGNG